MTTDSDRSKAKAFIQRALEDRGDEKRYFRRLNSNPNLAELGCLPENINEILNDQQPTFCHGLAFRMALYSDSSDCLFHRWEKLLGGAKSAQGWDKEYEHWCNPEDHWAKSWDRFYQFLWMLQCFEYLSDKGYDVSFPVSKTKPKPDLHAALADGSELFVECYFYTKWWGREHFLEELLRALDHNLIIKRTHNIKFTPTGNPMSDDTGKRLVDALAILQKNSIPPKLRTLRASAKEKSPQLVCKIGEYSIWLEGLGEYQPSQNARDIAKSW